MFLRLFNRTATTDGTGFSDLCVPFHYVTSSICGGEPLVLGGKSLKSTMHTSVDFPTVFGPVRVSSVLTCSNNVCGGFPIGMVHSAFRPSVVVKDTMSTGPNGPGRNSVVKRLRGVVVRGASCSLPSSLNVLVAFGCSSIGLVSFRHFSRLRSVNCGHTVRVVSSVGDQVRQEVAPRRIGIGQLTCGDGLPSFHFGEIGVANTGRRRGRCVRGRFRRGSSSIFAVRSIGQTCFHLLSSGVVSRVVPRTICGRGSRACSLGLRIGVRTGLSIHINKGISSDNSGRICFNTSCRGLGCCSGRFGFSKRLNQICGGMRLTTQVSFPAGLPASCGFVTSVSAFSCFGRTGFFSGGSGPTFGGGERRFMGLGISLPFLDHGGTRFNINVTHVRSECFRAGVVSFDRAGRSRDACSVFKNSVMLRKDALGTHRFTARKDHRGVTTRVFANARRFESNVSGIAGNAPRPCGGMRS